MDRNKEISYNNFLSYRPALDELIVQVNVSTKWCLFGTLLHLDDKRLDGIDQLPGHDTTMKTLKMFQLWLDTTPTANRRQILEVLRKSVVGENALADEYEKYLKELHETNYTPPSVEAVSILRRHIHSLNEGLFSPVQVSQLLYNKRCISEATLDEMERIDQSRSLDGKKTTLLTAIQETVSSDYRKLKDIATVLSDVKETKDIANRIMTEYDDKFPQEDIPVVQPQEVVGGNEGRACDILRNNYSALSQSITEPVRVARWLHEEVISDEVLSCVMSTRGSLTDCRAVLLKAVRDAVHSNYKHLELFVTVLRKFSETAHIGDAIFEEYSQYFCSTIEELEIYLTERRRLQSRDSTSKEGMDTLGDHKILFPRNMGQEFEEMRINFGSTFFQVRHIFLRKQNDLKIDEIKALVTDFFPDLKPQLNDKKTITQVLDVVKRKCNIINIRPLEVLIIEFNIKEAEKIIKEYKKKAKDFCKTISVRLCLEKKLQAVPTPSRLKSKTVVFILDWNPDELTLQDINDVLEKLEPLENYRIQIAPLGIEQSIERHYHIQSSINALEEVTSFSSSSMLSLTDSLVAADSKPPVIQKLIPEVFAGLSVLSVDSSGLIHHCSQYGVTLIIPEGAILEPATVWFGASLYSDKFKFGDYVPVTPIVWVYIDQKLMKPAELYLPHHIDVADQITKNKLSLLTANDEEFLKNGSLIFTPSNNSVMEVESALCKTYCHHFCSHCAGIKKDAYEDARKQCILAVAKKQEDSVTLLVHFCIFPFQPACKEVVEKQYTDSGFTVHYSKAITFDDEENGCITLKFEPDDGIVGWERDYDGISYGDDNKILAKEVDYIELMGWKEKDVSPDEIERLEGLERDLNYPPRLRFQFVCTNQALAKKVTKVKAILIGSTPLLKDTITLKRPDYDPSLSDLSATPDETADNSDDSQFESDSLLLELLLVVIAFKEHHGKWFAFGLALGLSHSQLRYIEPQLNKPEQYFRELLILWRRQNPTASWKPIARAFRKIHLEDAAIQLESHFRIHLTVPSHPGLPAPGTVGTKTSEAQAIATTPLDVNSLQNVLETLKESLFDPTKWHELGLALGLSSMTLNPIEDKHLLKTIEAWLRCQDDVGEKGGATWQNLIIAVGKVGDNAAAKKIQEKLKIND